MEDNAVKTEIRKRLVLLFLVATFFTLLLIIFMVIIGLVHSWYATVDFISTAIWSFTLIWVSTIWAVPRCFQNLPGGKEG